MFPLAGTAISRAGGRKAEDRSFKPAEFLSSFLVVDELSRLHSCFVDLRSARFRCKEQNLWELRAERKGKADCESPRGFISS